MRTTWMVPAIAALALSGCASMRGKSSASSDPTAQQVQTAQQQSQQALDRANEAQKKASEQAQKAASARQHVQQLQQELVQAQQTARQEQQKAEQMQRDATQATREASRQAQQSQQQASQGLSRATQQTAQGRQTTMGIVLQADADRLVVKPQSGDAMTFALTDQTTVRIDGREASSTDIRQGENATVAYEVSGTQPTARSVQVVTGNAPGSGSSSGTGAQQPSSSETSSGR